MPTFAATLREAVGECVDALRLLQRSERVALSHATSAVTRMFVSRESERAFGSKTETPARCASASRQSSRAARSIVSVRAGSLSDDARSCSSFSAIVPNRMAS